MPTKIIFDTNCFYDNYNLNSPIFSTTLNFCSNTDDYQFVIPNVIKDEITNNFRKQLQKKYSKIKSHIKWYNKFTSRNEHFLSREELEEDITNYNQLLDDVIAKNDILELDYPDHSHQAIVKRNSQNKKPFSESDAGYKDTLIWLNILDHLESTEDEIIFVTKNNTDFGTNDKLHSNLYQQIESLDIERDRIQYFSEQNRFLEEAIKPQLEVLDILDQIRNNEYTGFAFYPYVGQNIFDWFIESEGDIDMSSISDSLERPIVDIIDEVELIELADGKRVDKSKILLEYDLVARTLCDVLIDRHRPPHEMVAEAINIYSYKYNPQYMAGEIMLTLGAKLLIYFDPTEDEVLSTELKNFTAYDYV